MQKNNYEVCLFLFLEPYVISNDKTYIFRHAVALLGLCSVAAPICHLSSLPFAVYSLPLNVAMVYFSYKFYRNPDAQTSRNLFRYSLIYLPALIILMIIGKYQPTSTNTKKINTVKE